MSDEKAFVYCEKHHAVMLASEPCDACLNNQPPVEISEEQRKAVADILGHN